METLIYTTLELALINSLTVLGLYLSYLTLNVCDLSTDGCFTLGACTAAVFTLNGHPYLAIVMAMIAGLLSGLIVSILQTYLGINSLLAGIIVNTGLYSINIAVMGNSSLLNLNKSLSIYTLMKQLCENTFLKKSYFLLIDLFIVLAVMFFLNAFLKTRLGLAIRATGDNPIMVESSSINPKIMTIIGLSIANSFTALSGALLALSQKSVNIDIGSGMVTIALASLLIGGILYHGNKTPVRLGCAVLGTLVFRSIYALALRMNMPAYLLKLVSAAIVALTLFIPYLKKELPLISKRYHLKKEP